MVYSDISKQIEEYIKSLFSQHDDGRLFYHNIHHTQEVVDRAIEISSYYELSQKDLFTLTSAAWFHDTGYLFVGNNNHEEESVRIMENFLTHIDVPLTIIQSIVQCIMATKYGNTPVSLLEKIVCDADTYHFGTVRFQETNPLVKKEIETLTGKELLYWIESSIALLENHQFYTFYCQERLNEGKIRNLVWLGSLKIV